MKRLQEQSYQLNNMVVNEADIGLDKEAPESYKPITPKKRSRSRKDAGEHMKADKSDFYRTETIGSRNMQW